MKQLIENCLEFLLKTVGGMFILSILVVLVFLAIVWPGVGPEDPSPWLGIIGKDISSKVAQQYRLPFTKGVFVEKVFGNSPADISNLASGDFIVRFSNRTLFDEAQLRDMLFDMDPGEKVWMTVFRDGSYYNVMLRLSTRPTDDFIPAQAVAFAPAGGVGQMVFSGPGQMNTQLVAGLRQRQNWQSFAQTAQPGLGYAPWADSGFSGNVVAAQQQPMTGFNMSPGPGIQQLPGQNAPGAVRLTPLEEFSWAGMEMVTFNPANAASMGLPSNITGVQVEEVLRGSRANRGGMLARDLIREINGFAVYDVDSFANVVAAQKLTGGVMRINRNGRSMYVTVPEM